MSLHLRQGHRMKRPTCAERRQVAPAIEGDLPAAASVSLVPLDYTESLGSIDELAPLPAPLAPGLLGR
jgi:hypothetical protein